MTGIDFAVHFTPELAAQNETKETTATKVLHKASTRGCLNEGWLESYHTFSYRGFHDPQRMNFGKLRVLNEDIIAPGMGFPSHPRQNMEVICIPLEGAIEHHDNLGNNTTVRKGEIQVISAGSGLLYSQYNAHRDRLAKLLQIWMYPSRRDVEPRCARVKLDPEAMQNNLAPIVSPEGSGSKSWVHQQAWVYMGKLDKGYEVRHRISSRRNGVYVFLIRGEAEINGERIRTRDGMGLWSTRCVDIKATMPSEVLLIEVPVI